MIMLLFGLKGMVENEIDFSDWLPMHNSNTLSPSGNPKVQPQLCGWTEASVSVRHK
jgi:hypothetical protein